MPLPTFTTLGHGPLVVLLHGSGGGFRMFAPQVETLASLGWRAVAWDMPGYGYSAPIEPYTFKGLAERCIRLIEALAPSEGAALLLGQGMGGMVAQEIALRRPELIARLALIATSAGMDTGDAYACHIDQCLAWLAEEREMGWIADVLMPRLAAPAALPEGVRLARFCQGEVRVATWRRALEAMRGFDRRAALAHISVPTLLVAGAHDRVTPPALLRAMGAAIGGNASVVELAGAGHLPHLEQPDAFDDALLDFLRSAPRPPLH